MRRSWGCAPTRLRMKCVANEPPWRTFEPAPWIDRAEGRQTSGKKARNVALRVRAHSPTAVSRTVREGGLDEHTVNTFEVDQCPGCGAGARVSVCISDNLSA